MAFFSSENVGGGRARGRFAARMHPARVREDTATRTPVDVGAAAEQEARPELIDLCRLVDYNNHYDSETSTASASPGARNFALRDGL